MLEKWKRAVIHLECATDSEQPSQDMRIPTTRDIRFHGTALFLTHENRRYLLTARHVIWDEISAKRNLEKAEFELNNAEAANQQFFQWGVKSAQDKFTTNIFRIIFRVPSFDEVISENSKSSPESDHRIFLMNLGAGSSNTVPYTFSEPKLDLAIISLDQRNSDFANELQNLGFAPVAFEDIGEEPDFEGQELFTIGFPEETSIVGQVSQHVASAHWSSSDFSLPVFSFGRVAMLHKDLEFFWADMSIYPGNSGGPVVANNRLVGVVSGQATLPIDEAPEVRTRIPFGKIIKTSFVRSLLEEQAQKDKNFPGFSI
jgi:Trypsin-like peptidase domain